LLALLGVATIVVVSRLRVNPLNAELNPICHLLTLLGGATIVDVSRLRVKRTALQQKKKKHVDTGKGLELQ
jgi:hypothetical protein